MRIISEEDRLAIDAEDLLERGHDLAFGRIRLDAGQQWRHQVVTGASGRLQLLETMRDARVVAPRPQRLEPAHLALLGLGTDPQGGDVAALAVLVGVHAHDDPFVGLELALELEGGIGDLSLEEPVLDAAEHAALRIDLVEVTLRAALQLVGELLDEIGAAQW